MYTPVNKPPLSLTHPHLLKEWDYDKNNALGIYPDQIRYGNGRKVWWICKHGHEWYVSINSRTNKQSGCPVCAGQKVLAGFNDLATLNPPIASDWHPTKNGNLKPSDVTVSSHRKVWWICQHGHEWCASVASRTNKSQPRGCPVCAGRQVLAGFNDLATVNPKVASEWHPTKNGNLNPTQVTVSSNKKVWWICKHGHEWQATVNDRTQKSQPHGCPVCAGQKVLAGFNDLATVNPKLALEWHPTKNGDLKPSDVTQGTHRKVWWICEHGHEWCASVASRTNMQSGCPLCAGRQVLAGFNDLVTLNPNLASEWHPTKNGDLKPSDVTQGTHRKVWWICEHGHEWCASIANRTNLQNGCPVCAGQKVLTGFNDLATLNPPIASDWHPTKNGNLKPSDVTVSSHRKVWWICKHGHEWQSRIADRTKKSRPRGCPVCARLATTSYPESIVSYYMQSLGINCVLQASKASIPQLENMSVDLYLPAYNLAIEYDGSFYHPEGVERNPRDYKKDAALMLSGVNLIRIRDDAKMKKPFTCSHLKHYISYRYSCKNQDYENLQFVIQDIITNQLHLPNEVDFDLVRDNDEINKIKDCMNRSVNIQISK